MVEEIVKAFPGDGVEAADSLERLMLPIVGGGRALFTWNGPILLSWDLQGWTLGTSFVLPDCPLSGHPPPTHREECLTNLDL